MPIHPPRADPDLRQRIERSFPGRCVRSFVDLQGLDRAMVIASQSFTALIPLLILVSAVLPIGSDNTVADSIIRRFELTGDARHSVELVFAETQSGSVGVLSLFLLLFAGVSLTRRIQRMYLQAYRLEPLPRVSGSVHALMGLGALIGEITLLYFLHTLVRMVPFDWVVVAPTSVVASLLLWTSIAYLLIDRRLPWQRLIPGGALAATGVTVYGIVSDVYMPRMLEVYSDRYGLFGVTVAIVGWLLCVAVVIVAAAIIAGEFDRAPEGWARRLRARIGIIDPDPLPESGAPEAGAPYPD